MEAVAGTSSLRLSPALRLERPRCGPEVRRLPHPGRVSLTLGFWGHLIPHFHDCDEGCWEASSPGSTGPAWRSSLEPFYQPCD